MNLADLIKEAAARGLITLSVASTEDGRWQASARFKNAAGWKVAQDPSLEHAIRDVLGMGMHIPREPAGGVFD